ncbi:MAG: PadR family transcriptional regulator [Acidimicrobiales bacterium]
MHRAARGNVRAAILALLAEQKATGGAPMHGYQMIQELSTRTGGAWRPSPGSVYPTLQLLEDEGLVVSDAPEGKRVFELTEAGQAEFERTQGSRAPWDQVSDGFGESRLQLKIAARDTFVQLVWAARHGTEEQRAEILTLLGDLRNRLSALVPEGSAEHGPGQARGRGRARHAGWPGARATEADADWDPTESGDFEV